MAKYICICERIKDMCDTFDGAFDDLFEAVECTIDHFNHLTPSERKDIDNMYVIESCHPDDPEAPDYYDGDFPFIICKNREFFVPDPFYSDISLSPCEFAFHDGHLVHLGPYSSDDYDEEECPYAE